MIKPLYFLSFVNFVFIVCAPLFRQTELKVHRCRNVQAHAYFSLFQNNNNKYAESFSAPFNSCIVMMSSSIWDKILLKYPNQTFFFYGLWLKEVFLNATLHYHSVAELKKSNP